MYVALHSTTTSLVSPETEAWEFSAIDADFDNSSHFSPLVKRSRHNPHLCLIPSFTWAILLDVFYGSTVFRTQKVYWRILHVATHHSFLTSPFFLL
jgi:hypothetical protein